jgi:hypothetical protein
VPEKALFDLPQSDPLPELISAAEAPSWCQKFYSLSGIDPILHRFVQTERLFLNEVQSTRDTVLDDHPLAAGHYLLRIQGQKIASTLPLTANLKLRWSSIGLSKKEGGEFDISTADMAAGIVRPMVVDELTFVQFSLQGQSESNFMISKFSIEPDYLAYINAFWLKK